jgi:hypothetical protein
MLTMCRFGHFFFLALSSKGCEELAKVIPPGVAKPSCVWDSKRTPKYGFNELEELWHMKHRWVQGQACVETICALAEVQAG